MVGHEREVAIVVAAVAVSVVDVPWRAPPAALRLEDGALYDYATAAEEGVLLTAKRPPFARCAFGQL